ncbi:pollen receptor-like kinase 4 [Senna tora]|uniref:Pollen receptor-like kinase 4 n=1 Tax=Senna tora TaxID=362788 RepID=A0A834XEW2_9FABA|nr:pollen receptor-like kinase 4 [Senna tora]
MGAHAALPVRVPAALFFLILFSSLLPISFCGLSDDANALLKFKHALQIGDSDPLSSWEPHINNKPPCFGDAANWVGIFCFNNTVWGFRLENMGLQGNIDIPSLASMPHLRSISFMNNSFSGPFPNFNLLRNLKSLYLSFNHFSGPLPDDAFKSMNMLKKVYLSDNEFTGHIPSSLASLPNLLILRLDANKFYGSIPDFRSPSLKKVNFSNNDFEGPIPTNLTTFNTSSFEGNKRLCGAPLPNSCPPGTLSLAGMDYDTAKTSILKILLIFLLTLLIIVVIVAAIVIARLRSNQACSHHDSSVTMFQSQASNRYAPPAFVKTKSIAEHEQQQVMGDQSGSQPQVQYSKKGETGRLTFLLPERRKFDLQDLLKASAEILGSASFGSSYKAVMRDNQAVVVKRYKHMNNVPRDEFCEHMTRLASLSHPNLLPPVAYYYRKEEKLILSDFVNKGCLASSLHGNHNYEKPCLDWPTRLKIVKGIAKGLSYLYNALPSLVVPHGHLKSSNVLLDESYEPLLTDYALIPVINLDHAQQIMMPYKSPEYAQLGRITKKTDVWSLGIVILEILTGKFPENYLTLRHDTNSDIASWVNTMITEKRTGEVFDVDMGGVENSKSELLKLLKIGLSCCEENVERRLDIKEALDQIQQLKDSESDADYSLTITSEPDGFRAI